MITYVNTVLVSNLAAGTVLTAAPQAAADADTPSTDAGKWAVVTMDEKAHASHGASTTFPYIGSSNAGYYNTMKIGIVTSKNAAQVNPSTGATTYVPVIKWSNVISVDSLKSKVFNNWSADTEDTVYINFRQISSAISTKWAEGGKRVIVRLTFKDMPTRFRKWTESYEYVTVAGDSVSDIVVAIANKINKEYKRARVVASAVVASAGSNPGDADTYATGSSGQNAIKLVAMKYTDDNSVNSINWYNKVRFNANIYWTDPAAEGWESLNKNFPNGTVITKEPGKTYQASSKLVRDREAGAMGYQGILNHGEGTWPIIQPAMETVLSNKYSMLTLEFERTYRTADDLQRKTKECIELYGVYTPAAGATSASSALDNVKAVIDAFFA